MAVLEKITTAVTVSLDRKDQLNELHRDQYQGMAKTVGSVASHKHQNFNPYLSALLGIYIYIYIRIYIYIYIYCLKLHPPQRGTTVTSTVTYSYGMKSRELLLLPQIEHTSHWCIT